MKWFGVLMLKIVEIESVLMIGSEDGKVIDIKKVHEFFEFLEEGFHDLMVVGELFLDGFGLDGETFVVVFDFFVTFDFGFLFGELYFQLDDLLELLKDAILRVGATDMRVVGARDLGAEIPDEQREDISKSRHRDLVHEVTIFHRCRLGISSETN